MVTADTAPHPPLPVVAITGGDPCGIGPEVILKALGSSPPAGGSRLVLIGALAVFQQTANRLRLPLPPWMVVREEACSRDGSSRIRFVDLAHPMRFIPGGCSRAAGRASLAYVEAAIRLWRRGAIDGLVTAPVTKRSIEEAGVSFAGHTEYLARAMQARRVAMMFVSPRLRVVLLTRHLALREVARHVTSRLIRETVLLTCHALQRQFGIRRPRLAICGINPHAGEGGMFGREEQTLLAPLVRRLRREGVRLDGPFAADGLFVEPNRFDAVLCCYHDQGLIPFKMVARDTGCQMTLGLPIVRTSPDHGSALDIAGRGVANPGSMRYAIHLATDLISRPARVSCSMCHG